MTTCSHVQLSASTVPSSSIFFMLHFTCLFELSAISANCEKALSDLAHIYLGTGDLSSETLRFCLLIYRAKDQLLPISLLHWQGSYLNSWSDRWSVSNIFPKQEWWSSSRDLARAKSGNDLTWTWHDIFFSIRQDPGWSNFIYFKQLLWYARWKHGHERYWS